MIEKHTTQHTDTKNHTHNTQQQEAKTQHNTTQHTIKEGERELGKKYYNYIKYMYIILYTEEPKKGGKKREKKICLQKKISIIITNIYII